MDWKLINEVSTMFFFNWIEVFKNTFLPFVLENVYLDTHTLILCRLEAKLLRGINNLSAIFLITFIKVRTMIFNRLKLFKILLLLSVPL